MPRAKQYRMPPGADVDRFVVRVPQPLGDEIRTIADQRGVSLNIVMIEALEQYIRSGNEHQ